MSCCRPRGTPTGPDVVGLLLRGCRRARDRQGREAPLRGGLRPSLTAAARVGARCTGRDDGMAVLIEQQDAFGRGLWRSRSASVGVQAVSGRPMIAGLVVCMLATACALLAEQIL